MQLYIPYFLTTIAMLAFSFGVPNSQIEYGRDYDKASSSNRRNLCFFIIVLILVLFCAFKQIEAESIDEWAYRRRFLSYSGLSFSDVLEKCDGEYINGILTWLSTLLFKSDQGIFIVFGTLTVIFYLEAIRKYSCDFSFGVVLLMAMGIINTSFNITQQALACAIFVCFSNFIFEKKLFKFLLLVIACVLIHKASIILLVFWLFASSKKDRTPMKSLIFSVLVAFCVIYIYKSIPLLAQKITFLAPYIDSVEQGHEGVKTITTAINCVPAIIAAFYLFSDIEHDKITDFSANISLFHAAIYVASLSDRYIARLGMYTLPFCVMFYSRFALLMSKKSKTVFILFVVALYSLELYLRFRGCTYTFNFSF